MFPSLDDLGDTIDDLFSSERLGAAGKGALIGLKAEANKGTSSSSLSLKDGQVGIAGLVAEAKKSQMLESVDPYKYEQIWQDRLSTFAKIKREQEQ